MNTFNALQRKKRPNAGMTEEQFLAAAATNQQQVIVAEKPAQEVELSPVVVDKETLAEQVAKAKAAKTVDGKVVKAKIIKKTAMLYDEEELMLELLKLKFNVAEGVALRKCVRAVYELVDKGELDLSKFK